MMSQRWAIFLAVIAVLSIKDAFINGHMKHGENSAEDFAEFDHDDESASHKYTKSANEGFGSDDNTNNDEEVEIRDPTGYADTGKVFTVPLNSPPVKFSYWYVCVINIIIKVYFLVYHVDINKHLISFHKL